MKLAATICAFCPAAVLALLLGTGVGRPGAAVQEDTVCECCPAMRSWQPMCSRP